MGNGSPKLSVRPQKKHIVLLILACVLLLVSLGGAWDLAELLLRPEDPAPPADGGTGMGWSGVLLGEAVRGFALFVLLAAWIPCWCMGAVISVLLAMNRKDKPKWLWGMSLGLAVLLGLIAMGLLTVWILV